MTRSLTLKREALAALAPGDLAGVGGGQASINTCLDCVVTSLKVRLTECLCPRTVPTA